MDMIAATAQLVFTTGAMIVAATVLWRVLRSGRPVATAQDTPQPKAVALLTRKLDAHATHLQQASDLSTTPGPQKHETGAPRGAADRLKKRLANKTQSAAYLLTPLVDAAGNLTRLPGKVTLGQLSKRLILALHHVMDSAGKDQALNTQTVAAFQDVVKPAHATLTLLHQLITAPNTGLNTSQKIADAEIRLRGFVEQIERFQSALTDAQAAQLADASNNLSFELKMPVQLAVKRVAPLPACFNAEGLAPLAALLDLSAALLQSKTPSVAALGESVVAPLFDLAKLLTAKPLALPQMETLFGVAVPRACTALDLYLRLTSSAHLSDIQRAALAEAETVLAGLPQLLTAHVQRLQDHDLATLQVLAQEMRVIDFVFDAPGKPICV